MESDRDKVIRENAEMGVFILVEDDFEEVIKNGNWFKFKDGCINALSFLEQSGVLTQEQQQEIECSIMNLEVVKNG